MCVSVPVCSVGAPDLLWTSVRVASSAAEIERDRYDWVVKTTFDPPQQHNQMFTAGDNNFVVILT